MTKQQFLIWIAVLWLLALIANILYHGKSRKNEKDMKDMDNVIAGFFTLYNSE